MHCGVRKGDWCVVGTNVSNGSNKLKSKRGPRLKAKQLQSKSKAIAKQLQSNCKRFAFHVLQKANPKSKNSRKLEKTRSLPAARSGEIRGDQTRLGRCSSALARATRCVGLGKRPSSALRSCMGRVRTRGAGRTRLSSGAIRGSVPAARGCSRPARTRPRCWSRTGGLL